MTKKHYLVSIIERNVEEGDDLFTDFRLFSAEEAARDFYFNNLKTYMKENNEVVFDDCLMGENKNTFTSCGGGRHWEIQLTELED